MKFFRKIQKWGIWFLPSSKWPSGVHWSTSIDGLSVLQVVSIQRRYDMSRLDTSFFRFEDENDCDEEIWLKFFRVFSKSGHPRKLPPEKFALLSLLKEVKSSSDRKMIKLPTNDKLFSPPRNSCKNSSWNDVDYHVFPPNWHWLTRLHNLVLRKSGTHSRSRLWIY